MACFSPGESCSFSDLLLLLGVNFDLSRADIELVVEVLRIEEVSEALEGLRSDDIVGCWYWLEDIVIVLWSKMDGSKRLLWVLLKGVGSCGSVATILVVVGDDVDDDVVWRVELDMEGSCRFLICADCLLT